ncbi:MAG: hypothetical protein AB1743_08220 [Actinomycetota bacterium]
MKLLILLLIIVLLNFPFGYWRANEKRFSRGWFLAIHLPIPIVVFLRLLFGFGWYVLPYTFLAFATGQCAGGLTRSILSRWQRHD